MTGLTEDPPRNFREVAIVLHQILKDIDEIKQRQAKVSNWIVGQVFCPFIAAGLATTVIHQVGG